MTAGDGRSGVPEVMRLRVMLRDVMPTPWRRLEIAAAATLADLHAAILKAMGWENLDLHCFRILGRQYDSEHADLDQVRMADLRPRACERLTYEGIVTCQPVAGERRSGQAAGMTSEPAAYRGCRLPAEVISHAIWLYHVFSLSLRDVELILAERGIVATYESIRRWCLKFDVDFARRLRRRRLRPDDMWHLDEVSQRINGELHYLWRAVDQHCGFR